MTTSRDGFFASVQGRDALLVQHGLCRRLPEREVHGDRLETLCSLNAYRIRITVEYTKRIRAWFLCREISWEPLGCEWPVGCTRATGCEPS